MGKKVNSGNVSGTTKNARGNTGSDKKVRTPRTKPTRLSEGEKVDKYGKSKALNYKIKFEAKNAKQQLLYDTISDKQITLVKGAAGCGKSYTVFAKCLDLLMTNKYEKLIILTPIVPITDLGALPGELDQKIFFSTLADRSTIIKIFEKSGYDGQLVLDKLMESGKIEFDCIAYWRGRSISNSIVCVSESSNLIPRDLKTALTRVEGSIYVISGDPDQTDLPLSRTGKKMPDGLTVAFEKLKDIEEIGKVIFTDEDEIVRDPIIRKILNAWKNNDID